MDDESARREPEHDSDYDGAWKEALREHLAEFVEKYFPAEFAAIDWSYEPQWCDKELSQVLGQSGQRNRTVDLLVRVRLRTGQEQWILLHLEIQSSLRGGLCGPHFAVQCGPVLGLQTSRPDAGGAGRFASRLASGGRRVSGRHVREPAEVSRLQAD